MAVKNGGYNNILGTSIIVPTIKLKINQVKDKIIVDRFYDKNIFDSNLSLYENIKKNNRDSYIRMKKILFKYQGKDEDKAGNIEKDSRGVYKTTIDNETMVSPFEHNFKGGLKTLSFMSVLYNFDIIKPNMKILNISHTILFVEAVNFYSKFIKKMDYPNISVYIDVRCFENFDIKRIEHVAKYYEVEPKYIKNNIDDTFIETIDDNNDLVVIDAHCIPPNKQNE